MYAQLRRPSTASWSARPGAAFRLPTRPVHRCSSRSTGRIVCAAAAFLPTDAAQPPFDVTEVTSADSRPRAFPYPLPMSSAQKTLSSIPLALFYPGIVAGIGGLAYGVSVAAKSLPVDPGVKVVVSYGAAALSAIIAASGAVKAKKERDSASVVELYNLLVQLPQPTDLTPENVKAVGAKYGIDMHKSQLEGLCKIYGQLLEVTIPSGDNQLRGDEADIVRTFKEALGLTDEEAAPVHLEVGRRLNRQGFETKDRQQQFEQRKAFQRLMYVSQVVFGDQKAAFLLPWRRTFNLTDAQLFVARRDNANAIFKRYLDANGGEIPADRKFLRELREKQIAVKMLDENAVEIVREYTRKYVETHLTKALDTLRFTGKGKDAPAAVAEVRLVLDYSRKLARFSAEDDLVPGLGQVTVAGGPWGGDAKSRDAKELYKLYLDEELARLGAFTDNLDREATELQAVLCIRPKEAQALKDEVAAKLYRKVLKEAVISGRLEQAPSPAAVLQELCQMVRFSPEGAIEFHKAQYRTKVSSLMDKGKLTEQDAAELAKIRRILCIPADVANKVMRDTAGKVLEEVLTDIFMMGPKPVLDIEMQRVDSVIADLRMDRDVAVEVLGQVARERFQSYVQAAQKAGDRAGVAAPLKKMVQFNALVVTPLLERVRGTEAAKKELAELLKKATENAKKEGIAGLEASASTASPAEGVSTDDPVEAARKALQARRGEFGEEEKKGQKEITLKDVVQPEMRAELYKNYLMQSMSGEVVDLPVGGTIRKKGNEAGRQAEMTRLQQLADILGMSQMEVVQVHQGLGEQAYKQQAMEALRAGPMGEQTVQYLEDMRQQLGLPKEVADKVLKQARTEVYGTNAPAEDGGRWTVDRLLQMAKNGTKADSLMEEPSRRNLFRREVEQRLTDGTGDVDADYVTKVLPELLVLQPSKVRMTLKELAGSRKRRELVQAVSQYRQKRLSDVITSLQNLLSCSAVLPEEEPLAWPQREEIKNVYSLYCTKETGEAKQVALQRILGLTDTEVREARTAAAGAAHAGGVAGMEEEEAFF